MRQDGLLLELELLELSRLEDFPGLCFSLSASIPNSPIPLSTQNTRIRTIDIHLPAPQHSSKSHSIRQPFLLNDRNAHDEQRRRNIHAVNVLRSENTRHLERTGRLATQVARERRTESQSRECGVRRDVILELELCLRRDPGRKVPDRTIRCGRCLAGSPNVYRVSVRMLGDGGMGGIGLWETRLME